MGEAKQEAEAKQEEKKVEKQEEEKKEEKAEEKKEEAKPSPPPPIVLSVALHCVGCAKKIKKSILKCRGVESVEVDMKQNQVTVKGVLDPQVLCSRIQERTTRKAIVLSPLPPAEGDSKPEAVPSQVSGMATVELLVNMHCEACAEQLKRRILKMRVQTADTDLSTGKVTVTGTMDGEKLVEYISRRTGKLASIIPQPPKEEGKEEAEKKPEEEKPAEEKKEDKKEDEKAPQPEDGAGGNKEGDGKEEKGGGEEQKKEGEGVANDNANVVGQEEEDMMKKMIYWNGSITGEDEMARRMLHYMPVYVIQQPPPPPQFFSDENPNACCIS
ncbi:heavy metal-associated isoprenylated plant protein 9 isoform X2 [Musa acuminata AAA Group]|uniref:heavy metal-associated isoprenylated plant protein 9 isoform X2 n=1 Tax=Musa acuminata AAA Group TaxID=214697 RepID=UPI0031D77A32